jgi:hypothetical protein
MPFMMARKTAHFVIRYSMTSAFTEPASTRIVLSSSFFVGCNDLKVSAVGGKTTNARFIIADERGVV